jgi:hypothetical protein
LLERAIERWRPACVLATNSPRAERAALLAARRQGVPSLCLLDLFGLWERDWLVRPDYADALCVLNPQVASSLVAAGRPAAHIHVTGNPAFDSIHDPAVIARVGVHRAESGDLAGSLPYLDRALRTWFHTWPTPDLADLARRTLAVAARVGQIGDAIWTNAALTLSDALWRQGQDDEVAELDAMVAEQTLDVEWAGNDAQQIELLEAGLRAEQRGWVRFVSEIHPNQP